MRGVTVVVVLVEDQKSPTHPFHTPSPWGWRPGRVVVGRPGPPASFQAQHTSGRRQWRRELATSKSNPLLQQRTESAGRGTMQDSQGKPSLVARAKGKLLLSVLHSLGLCRRSATPLLLLTVRCALLPTPPPFQLPEDFKAAGPGRSGIAVFEERIIREEGMNGYIMTPVQQVRIGIIEEGENGGPKARLPARDGRLTGTRDMREGIFEKKMMQQFGYTRKGEGAAAGGGERGGGESEEEG
ncbi:hypothetical protein O3P69_000915 [Scylla paramamosain]|uniref:Uncharacterized protein n=1 Tax=Scylla paramamosain TaxID=85552 RepID=A0AAW0USY5_SCYPA